MKTMFQVCQRGRESRWTVTLRIQFTVPISTRSKPFSMQLTRRATRCKPAARPRSGSVIGRPQHRSSNQFGGDRYKRAIHRDVGSPGDIVPRPVGDFLDFAALAGHLDVFYCLLTSSPRELFPQLRKALPNKTRRRGKGIKLSVPLARESLLFAGRLRWSRRASPFQGGGDRKFESLYPSEPSQKRTRGPIALHALENLGTSDTGITMLRTFCASRSNGWRMASIR